MTALEILEGMRKRLNKPERWAQRNYARDEHGNDIDYRAPSAVCWCLMGAFYSVKPPGEESHKVLLLLAMAIRNETGTYNEEKLVAWNDDPNRRYEEVVAVLDRAVEVAKSW